MQLIWGPTPGAAHLLLVHGVVHLDEETAVFDAMLRGWATPQHSRNLKDETVNARLLASHHTRHAGLTAVLAQFPAGVGMGGWAATVT